ncbi:MAG: histidine phosphatase family protein [Erysipelothrix sp.]
MKTLYMMRHGQTLFNKQSKIQGYCDSPLTQLGIEQAKIAGSYFKRNNIKIDAAYSSTSERASDTLELVMSIPYTRVKNLKEWNFGDLEAEGEHLNPPLPYGNFFTQFGGESELDVRNRLNQVMINIAENDPSNSILVVSHGGSMAQFLRNWEENSPVKRTGKIQNCSIFKFEYEHEKFSLVEIIEHDFSTLLI